MFLTVAIEKFNTMNCTSVTSILLGTQLISRKNSRSRRNMQIEFKSCCKLQRMHY